MAIKRSVSKKDVSSIKSIVRKSFTGVVIPDVYEIYGYGQKYHGRYHLSTGDYDVMTVWLDTNESFYVVRALKDTFCDRIGSYRIISIQREAYDYCGELYDIKPSYCGFNDSVVKELLTTYLSLCPDKYTYDIMLKSASEKWSTEMEDTEEYETDEYEIEEDELEDIEEVIVSNKSNEYSVQRREELLTLRTETLDNLYCLAMSYINGMYRNFKYEIEDMKLSCSSKEEVEGNTIIRDYIACRVNLNYVNFMKHELSMFYIVVRDEQVAESLIYI